LFTPLKHFHPLGAAGNAAAGFIQIDGLPDIIGEADVEDPLVDDSLIRQG
jgi:hypothetical protein